MTFRLFIDHQKNYNDSSGSLFERDIPKQQTIDGFKDSYNSQCNITILLSVEDSIGSPNLGSREQPIKIYPLY